MHIKTILVVLAICALYLHESEAAPKLGLIKAKAIGAKVIGAKVIGAKALAAKAKLGAVIAKGAKLKALAAAKAIKTKLVVGAVGAKAIKAFKVGKIVKTAAILKKKALFLG